MTSTNPNSFNYLFDLQNAKLGDNHRFNLFWLLIFSLLLFFIGIGLRDPWPADEPRFAQVAKEMVENGQWFFPTRGGELYPDKPPVFMWFIATFFYLTKSIKLAFLLPSAISSVITVFIVYDIGRRLWNTTVAWYAAILLLLSIQFTLQAKTAQIDALVCCWITLACYGLLRFFLMDGRWRWYYFAWFFMGIGIITKGVGFLPALMLIPYFIARRIDKHGRLKPGIAHGALGKFLGGPMVMLGAISLWFIPMLLLVASSDDPSFEMYKNNILFRQTITRYADSWHHVEPFWYYLLEVIPVFWLPISLILPWLVKHWKKAFGDQDFRIILPLSWVLLVILFFSLSSGKRGVYVLPALPMLALVSAPFLRDLIGNKTLGNITWSCVLLISTYFVILGFGGIFETKFAMKLGGNLQNNPWLLIITVGVFGATVCFFTYFKQKFMSWAIFIPVLWIVYSTWGYVLINSDRTPHNIFASMKAMVPADAEIAIVNMREQFLLFSPFSMTHFGYHTPIEQQEKTAWLWQSHYSKRYVLVELGDVIHCYDASQAIPLGFAHRTNWGLLALGSRLDSCDIEDLEVKQYHYSPIIKKNQH